MTRINDDLIQKLETLAQLRLSDSERTNLSHDLESILDMVAKLSEVNTEGVQALTHMIEREGQLRQDEVKDQLTVSQALENAPDTEGPYFRVPKVIQRDS